jgi:hypothetical protein
MDNSDYFLKLSAYAKNLLDKLPIEKTPQPLDYAVGMLYEKVKKNKENEVEELISLWPQKTILNKAEKTLGIGLNTIGMLTDRFTILLIKEWCLRNKSNNPQKADELFESQTKDIIACLANSVPGNSAINSKITNIKTDTKASSWEEAFYGMLTINLVLWESQEVLYIKDISKLPYKELRDYIHWFAHGNMERNVLMELCEIRYWEKTKLILHEK